MLDRSIARDLEEFAARVRVLVASLDLVGHAGGAGPRLAEQPPERLGVDCGLARELLEHDVVPLALRREQVERRRLALAALLALVVLDREQLVDPPLQRRRRVRDRAEVAHRAVHRYRADVAHRGVQRRDVETKRQKCRVPLASIFKRFILTALSLESDVIHI